MKAVEAFLWFLGTALTLVCLGGLAYSEYSRVADIAEFKGLLAEAHAAEPPPENTTANGKALDIDPPRPDQALWSDSRKAHFKASQSQAPSGVLGLLTIPAVDLEVPLYDGASELHLNLGIARIEGTARPGVDGNLGIAGHRDGYFRALKDIKFGDEILLTTMAGVLTYKVDELNIVDPSAIEVLDDRGQASITLVTCYPFYFVGHAPERFIVHATLQET